MFVVEYYFPRGKPTSFSMLNIVFFVETVFYTGETGFLSFLYSKTAFYSVK